MEETLWSGCILEKTFINERSVISGALPISGHIENLSGTSLPEVNPPPRRRSGNPVRSTWLVFVVLIIIGTVFFIVPGDSASTILLFVSIGVIVAATLLRPWIGVLFIVSYTPFMNFVSSRVAIAGFPGGAIYRDAVFLSCVVGFLVLEVVRGKNAGTNAFSRRFRSFLTLYLIAVALYSLAAPDMLVAFMAGRTAGWYMTLALLIPRFVSKKRAASILSVAVLIGFVVAMVGLVEVVTDGEVLRMLGFRSDYAEKLGGIADAFPYFMGIRRATAGMGNYIIFGSYMVIVAVMALAFLPHLTSFRWRFLGILTFLVSMVSAVLSFSRGVWVVMVLVVLIFFVAKRGHVVLHMALALLVVVVIQVAISEIGGGVALSERLYSSDELTLLSNYGRIEQAKDAVGIAMARPLGIGLGTMNAARSIAAVQGSARGLVPDSYAFQVLAEMGWPMLVAWITLIFVLLAELTNTYKNLPEGLSRDLVLSAVGMVVVIVINSIVNSVYSSNLLNIIFWTYVGLIFSAAGNDLQHVWSANVVGRRRKSALPMSSDPR